MAAPKTIALYGGTGSIGASTLDLVARFPDRYQINVLTGGKNIETLAVLAQRFQPDHVGIADETGYAELSERLKEANITIHAGADALNDLTTVDSDLVVSAVTGTAGLLPTLKAVEQGRVVAIANKESLVTAGAIIKSAAEASGATLLPIDSEHNAIFQAWTTTKRDEIDRITLTASGGPFWAMEMSAMAGITPEQAVRHPNWSMGAKISVDSATMMNKGLEVIEAAVLFDLPEDRVDVLVHPSSVVHGMVHYRDGSTLAQMGPADMRVPISYALAWPERLTWSDDRLDLAALSDLQFLTPDHDRFPCLELARQASRQGGLAPTILNAANEMAVDYFLNHRIGFLDIADLTRHMLDMIDFSGQADLEAILEKDRETRLACDHWLSAR
jgi:1-deoxy-D-xylulose-5-phosphate reductoisomerase